MGLNPPFTMGITPLAGLVMLVALVVYIPSLILFWKRRHIHPIRGRHPFAVLLFGILVIVWHVLLCLRFIFFDYIPCFLHIPLQRLAIQVFGHLYLYRLWLLYIEHHRTFNKRRVALSNNLTTDMDESIPEPETMGSLAGWLSSRKPRDVLIFTTISFMLFIIIPTSIAIPIALPASSPYAPRGCILLVHYLITLFEVGIQGIVFVYFSFKFARLDADNFNLKNEFRMVGVVFILNLLLVFLITFIPAFAMFNNMVMPIQLLPVAFGIFCSFIIGINHTTTLSYRENKNDIRMKTTNSAIMEEQIDLGRMLQVPEFFRAFFQFLSREFAIENLLFWQQAVQYRESAENQTAKPVDLVDQAQKMYSLYFANDSPLELNVSSELAASVTNAIDNAKRLGDTVTYAQVERIFAVAEEDIFKLMMLDPFPRFRNSPEFAAVAGLAAEAHAHRAMFKDAVPDISVFSGVDLEKQESEDDF